MLIFLCNDLVDTYEVRSNWVKVVFVVDFTFSISELSTTITYCWQLV